MAPVACQYQESRPDTWSLLPVNRLLTFADVANELSTTTGREIRYIQIPQEAFADALTKSGAPLEIAWLLNYLFDTVLDGRNAYIGDGIERALGRGPTDFTDYAHRIAALGAWKRTA